MNRKHPLDPKRNPDVGKEKPPDAARSVSWRSGLIASRLSLLASLRVLNVALCACSFSCLSVYIFFAYRTLFHSDSAIKVLLAQEIARTGRFFPPEWNYVNDFMIFFPHVFIIPFVGMIHDLYLLHAVGVFASLLLFVIALSMFFSRFAPGADAFWPAAAFILSGPSTFLAEYLFGQAAYLMILISTLLTIVFIYQFYDGLASDGLGGANPRRRTLTYGFALFFLLFVNVMAGLRGILSLVVPAVASLVLFVCLERAARGKVVPVRASSIVLGTIAFATIAGAAAFVALNSVAHLVGAPAGSYATFPKILDNLKTFTEGFLAATGALPAPTRAPLSLYGMLTAYRLIVFLGIALLPLFLLRGYRRISTGPVRFVVLYQIVSFAVTAYYYIFGVVAINQETFRYFTPNLVLAVVIAVLFAASSQRFGHARMWLLTILLAPLVLANCIDLLSPLVTITRQPNRTWSVRRSENPYQRLANWLRVNGLRYGYATYWNAAVVTVLSGGEVRVNAVKLEGAQVLPLRHLSSNAWYSEEFYRGPTFLLLRPDEIKLVSLELLEAFAGKPARVLATDYGSVLVFDSNLAGKLPMWSVQPPMAAAMRPGDCRAELAASPPVIETGDGRIGVVRIRITNTSKTTLSSGGQYPVFVGAHLYDEGNRLKVSDFSQAPLAGPLRPHESATETMAFPAPPKGKYVLEIDLFQAGVSWFGATGNRTAKIGLIVR